MGKTRSAFSLVEMLVAMAVAAVLVALTTSGLQRAMGKAREAKCLGNLRAIGAASALYSADWAGRLPQSSHYPKSAKDQGVALTDWAWQFALPAYLGVESGVPKVFRSPLSPTPNQSYAYAINDFLTPNPYGSTHLDYSRRQAIERPAETVQFTLKSADHGSDHFHFASDEEGGASPQSFAAQVHTGASNGAGNYLFVDGHVETIRWETLKSELTRPGSRFLNPAGLQN